MQEPFVDRRNSGKALGKARTFLCVPKSLQISSWLSFLLSFFLLTQKKRTVHGKRRSIVIEIQGVSIFLAFLLRRSFCLYVICKEAFESPSLDCFVNFFIWLASTFQKTHSQPCFVKIKVKLNWSSDRKRSVPFPGTECSRSNKFMYKPDNMAAQSPREVDDYSLFLSENGHLSFDNPNYQVRIQFKKTKIIIIVKKLLIFCSRSM